MAPRAARGINRRESRCARLVPPPLVYGYTSLHGDSVVVDDARTVRLADELDRVRACGTLGELRTVARAGLPEAGDLTIRAADDDAPVPYEASAIVIGARRIQYLAVTYVPDAPEPAPAAMADTADSEAAGATAT